MSRVPVSWCRRCDASDYTFAYTECAADGSRWRVALPLHTNACEGQYSLGGGARFEEFYTLPTGFSVENFVGNAMQFDDVERSRTDPCPSESGCFAPGIPWNPVVNDSCPWFVIYTYRVSPDEHSAVYSKVHIERSDFIFIIRRSRTGWIVRDSELLYIPSPCVSRLSFSAQLVRPGYAEFSYRMPKNNRALSLHVEAQNQQCQSYRCTDWKPAGLFLIRKYASLNLLPYTYQLLDCSFPIQGVEFDPRTIRKNAYVLTYSTRHVAAMLYYAQYE
uniref:Laminin N-terminal domain-containing protein n=1 Tax=Angiostrongylus cantonensis TaxID=6313 RepID=A0A0K0DIE7_ANGCA